MEKEEKFKLQHQAQIEDLKKEHSEMLDMITRKKDEDIQMI